jgi:DegV family protein with EDD domain
MASDFQQAIVAGVERLSAWADLLDRINVFPVADGDTGRNLVVSLAPLRRADRDHGKVARALLLSARGNSGNIANRFMTEFIQADSTGTLWRAVEQGRRQAWQAVHDPRPGTMLTLFDALSELLKENAPALEASFRKEDPCAEKMLLEVWGKKVLGHLEETVRSTPDFLPRLKEAGVVDAGALGMFLYFEGFFRRFLKMDGECCPVTAVFRDSLSISRSFQEEAESGYCVDAVLNGSGEADEAIRSLSTVSDSVVVIRDAHYLKIHLHTAERDAVRSRMESLGSVVKWVDDDLDAQTRTFRQTGVHQAIHIMTDAAGSVIREDARALGITLLDSYVTSGETCLPETHFDPSDVYAGMRQGIRAVTSQASVFERHQHYESALGLHEKVLYLCVGSVFTGNYDVAIRWKKTHDPGNRLIVIDTAAASGRLGLIALVAARLSIRTEDPEKVVRFARRAVACCEEYIFPDKLHYLAAGGRLSRTGAFFGDVLHMKPVISPLAEGAKKVGVVKNRAEQIAFALDRLDRSLPSGGKAILMLEYSDNHSWVEDAVKPEIAARYRHAEIMVRPISLTTGVHTGPGTWGLAFLADL